MRHSLWLVRRMDLRLGAAAKPCCIAMRYQAHIETYTGLVEVGVGVIPGWGGCKELLFRAFNSEKKGIFGGAMPATKLVFETIAMAKVAESADIARDMNILNAKSRISMNRDRLLHDAKELVLELAVDYTPPEQTTIKLAGKSGRVALDMAVKGMAALWQKLPRMIKQ